MFAETRPPILLANGKSGLRRSVRLHLLEHGLSWPLHRARQCARSILEPRRAARAVLRIRKRDAQRPAMSLLSSAPAAIWSRRASWLMPSSPSKLPARIDDAAFASVPGEVRFGYGLHVAELERVLLQLVAEHFIDHFLHRRRPIVRWYRP